MDTKGIIEQTYNRLSKAKHVLLIPHRLPDSDSLGGALVMKEILERINIKATIYCHTHTPTTVQFMIEPEELAQTVPSDADVLCVFDSGDAQYAFLPEIIEQLNTPPITINIDHHISNEMYADINLVMPHMPSTTSVLYTAIDHLGLHITHTMAYNMMAGLLNDTGIFSNPMTNQHAMDIGAALMQAGAHTQNLINIMYRIKPIGTLKLWGRALERIKKHPKLSVAYTCLTNQDHLECGVSYEEGSGLANFFNLVSDCPMSLVLKETADGYIKGSLRTTFDDVNVSHFALAMGGGGHKRAAGFTIPGKLTQTKTGWKITN